MPPAVTSARSKRGIARTPHCTSTGASPALMPPSLGMSQPCLSNAGMDPLTHLDGHHEGVSQVKSAGDIGRRDDHNKLLCCAVLAGLEEATVLPPGIPAITAPEPCILGTIALRDAPLISPMHSPSQYPSNLIVQRGCMCSMAGFKRSRSGHQNACA